MEDINRKRDVWKIPQLWQQAAKILLGFLFEELTQMFRQEGARTLVFVHNPRACLQCRSATTKKLNKQHFKFDLVVFHFFTNVPHNMRSGKYLQLIKVTTITLHPPIHKSFDNPGFESVQIQIYIIHYFNVGLYNELNLNVLKKT